MAPAHARLLAAAVLFAALWGLDAAPRAGAVPLIEAGDTAVVATSAGDTLTVRTGPGVGYPALAAIQSGTMVLVLDGPVVGDDGLLWYRVASAGLVGWCAAEWLAAPDVASGTRYIGGTDGGANLRDEPSLFGEILLTIPDGGAVALLDASRVADGLDWSLVRFGDTSGWVMGAFLDGVAAGDEASIPPQMTGGPATPSNVGTSVIGGNARVAGTDGYDLRIRDGIGPDAPPFATVAEDTVVAVVNGPLADKVGATWYGINFDGLYGWVSGEYLIPTDAPPSQRAQGSVGMMAAYGGAPMGLSASVASNPARGAAIVATALRYLGTAYVWGGTTPAGWDCSGMIQWLYQQVTGVTLPRVSQDQWRYGTPLQADQIEAGDLVFFADTDGPGITHNGIALGDGRFIHARSAALGTVISRLDEPYWTEHYAGARRP